MAEKGYGPIVTHTVIDGLAQRQVVILEVAVQKLVRLGEQAGITLDDMIALLNEGMDLRDLVDHLTKEPA